MLIKCEFYSDGKCLNNEALLVALSDCEHCPSGKPPDTCCLTCDCELETCNRGEVIHAK